MAMRYDYACNQCGVVSVRLSMAKAKEVMPCPGGKHSMRRLYSEMPSVSIPDPGGYSYMNRVLAGETKVPGLKNPRAVARSMIPR
jgi:putative FmdB family regulatory protein